MIQSFTAAFCMEKILQAYMYIFKFSIKNEMLIRNLNFCPPFSETKKKQSYEFRVNRSFSFLS